MKCISFVCCAAVLKNAGAANGRIKIIATGGRNIYRLATAPGSIVGSTYDIGRAAKPNSCS